MLLAQICIASTPYTILPFHRFHLIFYTSYLLPGAMSLSKGTWGTSGGYTLDGVPVQHRAHTTRNTSYPTVICKTLDCGRKTEHPEEPHQTLGEHANYMDTDLRKWEMCTNRPGYTAGWKSRQAQTSCCILSYEVRDAKTCLICILTSIRLECWFNFLLYARQGDALKTIASKVTSVGVSWHTSRDLNLRAFFPSVFMAQKGNDVTRQWTLSGAGERRASWLVRERGGLTYAIMPRSMLGKGGVTSLT